MKSLELNWLARREKWLRLPALLFIEGASDWVADAGGYYVAPREGDFFFEGQHRSCKSGLIAVLVNHCGSIEQTIAHEWRHHWQSHHGIKLTRGFEEAVSYRERVRRHFQRPIEMDALRFTLEVCGPDAEPEHRDVLKIPSRRAIIFNAL